MTTSREGKRGELSKQLYQIESYLHLCGVYEAHNNVLLYLHFSLRLSPLTPCPPLSSWFQLIDEYYELG